MVSLVIRKAVIQDASEIAELAKYLGYDASVSLTEDLLQEISDVNSHALLVAVNADEVVGWVHAFTAIRIGSAPFAEIGGLVVAESYRKQGVGSRLVAAAENWANECGQGTLRVRTRISRTTAQDFYLRSGFRKIKQQAVFDKYLKS